jgi:hypothetical protein
LLPRGRLAAAQIALLLQQGTVIAALALPSLPFLFAAPLLLLPFALTPPCAARWGPLLGPGKLFDPTRFFIFCANVLGSPYGSASPCTRHGGELVRDDDDAEAGASGALRPQEGDPKDGTRWWGPEFPATSTRDDVR